MPRSCDICGAEYEAKRSTSRYCSTRCRTRASRARRDGGLVDLPRNRQLDTGDLPSVTASTRAELTGAKCLDSPLGATALALAARLDAGNRETGAALASLAKQLQATIEAAKADGETELTPLDRARDELSERRERRGA